MTDLRRWVVFFSICSLITACGTPGTRSLSRTSPTTTTPPATVDSTPPAVARGPIYLALGDSAPVWDGNASYPNLIASHYSPSVPRLELVNLAVSGETSASMLNGRQQQQALQFVHAHQGSIVLVTIDIGGNDVLPCVSGINVNLTCLQQAEATMVTNVNAILNGLRQAAGPSAPIVGMSYYDPFLGDWLAGGAARQEATLSVLLATALNGLLATAYQKVDAPVADVQDAFQSTDLSTMVASSWGPVPVAVAQACELLDITCHAGQLEGFGDDPNNAGAEVIAKAFENTIGSLQPPG